MARCSGLLLAAAAPIDSMSLYEVRLKQLPLKEGERISAITLNIAWGNVRTVTLPLDWTAEVGYPDASDGTTVWLEAGHGTSFLNSGEEIGTILTILSNDGVTGHTRCDGSGNVKGCIVVQDTISSRTNEIPVTSIEINSSQTNNPSN